jgi:lipopolysaccharide export system permease protein
MRLERIEDRLSTQGSCPRDHKIQDRLVAEMHSVKVAQGQNRTLEGPIQLRNSTKDFQTLPSSARLHRVRILSHYFVARFLGLFSTVLLAAFLILATVELVLNLDDLSASGSATPGSAGAASLGALRYLWIRLASYYLADLLPLACFIATFITYAWAGRSMELVAVQAGGIRLRRIVLPVLAAALILSFATAVLHETLILRARQIWSSETRGSHDQLDFSRKSFWYHKGPTITNITSADQKTRTLHGVEIFERGPHGAVIRVVRVDRVQISTDGVWHLENAAIWTFDPANPTAHPRFEENVSVALNLDALHGKVLLGADPGILPLPALAEYLDSSTTETSSDRRRLESLFHERLSRPWLVFVFGWLALPFALRVDERGLIGGPAAAAVATLGAFFLVQSAGTTLSRQGLLPVGLTPWLEIGLVLLGTAIALRRQAL